MIRSPKCKNKTKRYFLKNLIKILLILVNLFFPKIDDENNIDEIIERIKSSVIIEQIIKKFTLHIPTFFALNKENMLIPFKIFQQFQKLKIIKISLKLKFLQ